MTSPGAGDIAHVYMVDVGPDISHEDVQHISYDDGTSQLLVVKGGHVFAYDVSRGAAGDSSLRWMYPLQVGKDALFTACYHCHLVWMSYGRCMNSCEIVCWRYIESRCEGRPCVCIRCQQGIAGLR